MLSSRLLGIAGLLTLAGAGALGCGSVSNDDLGVVRSAVSGPKCDQVQAKDPLIAQLVIDSWRAQYPLTQLSVAPDGSITGANVPDMIVGDLDIINSVPEAKASVAQALQKVSGLPDYGFGSITYDSPACTSVPAWTPAGTTMITTESYGVSTNGVNDHSWKTTRKEFGQECPLIKVNGDKDSIDPPGDGSTNSYESGASASGVRANAFGICPSGADDMFCMLSYATGTYFFGRKCQTSAGALRCLVYPPPAGI